jgi:hypothetical protein
LQSPSFLDVPLPISQRIIALRDPRSIRDATPYVRYVIAFTGDGCDQIGDLLQSVPLALVDGSDLERLRESDRVPRSIDGRLAFDLIRQTAADLTTLKKDIAEISAAIAAAQATAAANVRRAEEAQRRARAAEVRECEGLLNGLADKRDRLRAVVRRVADAEERRRAAEQVAEADGAVQGLIERAVECTERLREFVWTSNHAGVLARLRALCRGNPFVREVEAVVTPPEAVVAGHEIAALGETDDAGIDRTFWARGTTEVNGFRIGFGNRRVRVDGVAIRTNGLGIDTLALPKTFTIRASVNGWDWDVLLVKSEFVGFVRSSQLLAFQCTANSDKWYQWIEYNQTDAVYPYADREHVVALSLFELFGSIDS